MPGTNAREAAHLPAGTAEEDKILFAIKSRFLQDVTVRKPSEEYRLHQLSGDTERSRLETPERERRVP